MHKSIKAEELISMVIEKENEFIPDENTVIFRYMDFIKFMSLLQNKKIFFTRADKFEDPLEGEVPSYYINRLTTFYHNDIINKLSKFIDLDDKTQDILNKYQIYKTQTFISCWTEFINDKESYALWKIYAKEFGVAIQTTVKKLRDITKEENVSIYRVRYIKDDKESVILPKHIDKHFMESDNFFVCKKAAYSYENEIRAICTGNGEFQEICVSNLNKFIDKIYVSPFAEKWFLNLVKDILVQYRLDDIDLVTSQIVINKSK
jgi:hypothetical protein